jgi:hypothetical protein
MILLAHSLNFLPLMCVFALLSFQQNAVIFALEFVSLYTPLLSKIIPEAASTVFHMHVQELEEIN